MDEMRKRWRDFISLELLPALQEFKKQDNGVLEVFWSEDVLNGYETESVFLSDAFMALGSMAFILIYLTLHTQSLILSLSSLFLIVLSIPTSFVTVALVSGSNRITGTSSTLQGSLESRLNHLICSKAPHPNETLLKKLFQTAAFQAASRTKQTHTRACCRSILPLPLPHRRAGRGRRHRLHHLLDLVARQAFPPEPRSDEDCRAASVSVS